MALNDGSRTKNAGKNTVSAMTNKIAILLLTFISRKFFIQFIGVEYLGINGLFSNILTLLSIADLGIGTAMNVSLYKPIAENDTHKITALINYFKRLYNYIAICVMLIGLLLTPFLKYIVNLDSDIPYLYVYYVIFVLKSAASYILVYKSALIRADQKTYLINKIEIWVTLLKVIAQIIIIVAFKNYLLYIILDVVCVIINNIIVSRKADKEYPFLKGKDALNATEKKGIFSDLSSIFIFKIAWALINGTDNILMSILVGTIYVGYYSNYYTITNNIEIFIALIFNSITAGVGNLVATGDAKKRYKTFQSMQMISFWICGIVTICLFFLTQDFIVLWLGEDMLLDNLTLVAIVINVFFSTCMRPVWTFREGTGMYRQIRYIMVVTAVLNLVLSVILGKYLGLSGILFATSISKISTYFWYEPNILFKKFFDKKVVHYYLDYLMNTVLLLIAGVLCYFAVRPFEKISIFTWLIKAFICMAIVCIIYFLRYFRTEEFANIKEKAYGLLKR